MASLGSHRSETSVIGAVRSDRLQEYLPLRGVAFEGLALNIPIEELNSLAGNSMSRGNLSSCLLSDLFRSHTAR